ncbi:MAG: tRNA (adenosine(37)-N6)-threonylcarbamoyltransferase complex transferase subunit TsaD [Candidatus Omnitrophica bacterium]|nr:tRNA (adenosine(37)-N6)-threonylcarbamoyltransferase complex transferase subunit TsaD [Candidatus Omnitrophota bacterium]MDD5081397.1 tRNA (adenosine(37)-N6)-threonylcarbamoyltransferase complex transferase subunit TsaD [Candidatus Omnitrophota bacterium]MDD5440764.1 tRNA (adenosine(37)-N6)-threonylcarbamoyltransferase complex transferase subunit TsaD [Candidatus Omnitrophota bacterium]
MYTLGIETSCDETSCAVLYNRKVLSNVTISSLKEHAKYGGVVPEIATRAHLRNINVVTREAVKKAGLAFKKIDLITVTANPGLIGALLVGFNYAKSLALSLNKPFIGVNHLYAHIFSSFLDRTEPITFPFLGVVLSGGHSDIYLIKDFDKIKVIGKATDDACGEVYDKIARAFGMGYPGGKVIDDMFDTRYKDTIPFKCGRRGFDLSFSGIKTAVLYKGKEFSSDLRLTEIDRISILSSFQNAVVNTIIKVVSDASGKYNIRHLVFGGGVLANKYLRMRLHDEFSSFKLDLPPLKYTGDNAAMVAGLGFCLYNKKGFVSKVSLKAKAR